MSRARQVGSPGRAVIAAAVLAVALPVIAGARWDSYRPRQQYISELGARGAPDGAAVSAGFAVVGVLLLSALALAGPRRPRPIWAWWGLAGVLGGIGGSYLVSGVARCEAGCPEDGSIGVAQQVHNTAGGLGYVVAIAGLVAFGLAARSADRWRTIAWIGLLAAPVLLGLAAATRESDQRGLLQRLVEVAVLAWAIAVTARLAPTDRP